MEEPRQTPEVPITLIGSEQLPVPEAPVPTGKVADPAAVVAPAPVTDLPAPTPAPAPVAAVPPATNNSNNPAVADDVDVIEKEWVDRAEQVIKDTAGDPHQEEEQVEDLQIDYMKKRYGKDIKKSQ